MRIQTEIILSESISKKKVDNIIKEMINKFAKEENIKTVEWTVTTENHYILERYLDVNEL